MSIRLFSCVLVACAAPFLASAAHADTITFSGLSHGEEVTNQIAGITITANNKTRTLTSAAIFDTTTTSTADPDLEDPFTSAGNLSGSTTMGNALILQENGSGAENTDGVFIFSSPDDEGSRRSDDGNWIKIEFDTAVSELGWDVIDLEQASSEKSSVLFHATDGTEKRLYYDDGSSSDLQTTMGLGYGNNSLNRISPISAADLFLDDILWVEFDIGGSMAIDNLSFEPVPEPGTLMLLGLGTVGLVGLRRRRSGSIETEAE